MLSILYKGRKEKFAASLSSPINDIHKAACSKFGLVDPSSYALTYRDKKIDMSLPLRLSNIAINSTLEIVLDKSSSASNIVKVALSFNGTRLMNDFVSSTTLLEIIEYWKQQEKVYFDLTTHKPRVVYLRQQLSYIDLVTQKLQDLGVKDSCLLRLEIVEDANIYTLPIMNNVIEKEETMEVEKEGSMEVESKIDPDERIIRTEEDKMEIDNKIKENERERDMDRERNIERERVVNREMKERETERLKLKEREHPPILPPPIPTLPAFGKDICRNALVKLRESCFDSDSRESINIIITILDNIIANQDVEKFRQLKLNNATIHNLLTCRPGAIDFLIGIGMIHMEIEGEQKLVLKKEREDCNLLNDARGLLDSFSLDIGLELRPRKVTVETSEGIRNTEMENQISSFDPFSSNIKRMTPYNIDDGEKESLSLTEKKILALQKKASSLSSSQIPQRNLCLLPPSFFSSSKINNVVIEDEKVDNQLLLESLGKKMKSDEEKKQLKTQSMRELENLEKKKIYDKVVIRVQLPDRKILQAFFHPLETVQEVINVLHEVTGNSSLAFELIVSPPRRVLDVNKTFEQEGLVPASLLYLVMSGGILNITKDVKIIEDAAQLDAISEKSIFPLGQKLVEEEKSSTSISTIMNAISSSSSFVTTEKSSSSMPKWFKK